MTIQNYVKTPNADLNETVASIEKAIAWNAEALSKQIDIDTYLDAQNRLTHHLFTLAMFAGHLKVDWNNAYFMRKVAFNRAVKHYRAKDYNVNAAQNEAENDTVDKRKEELERESIAYQIDLLLRHGRDTLQSMHQAISHLKKEHELNQFVKQKEK